MPKLQSLLLPGLLALAMEPSGAQTWIDTRTELAGLAEHGQLDAAAALGDRYLDEVTQAFGEASVELAEAHLLLAQVDSAAGAHLDAEGNILDALAILEPEDSLPTARVIAPLILLGDTYQLTGDYREAIAAYDQAKDIARRIFGLVNLDQIEILHRMATSAAAMHDADRAKDFRLAAIDIVERIYGDDSPEYLDAYFRYADWLKRVQDFDGARETYTAMRAIVAANYDGDPRRTIELHVAEANNERDRYTSHGMRRRVVTSYEHSDRKNLPDDLEDALRIARNLDPPDPVLEAAILRDIGDWNVVYGRQENIATAYEESWRILDGVDGGADLQRAWFAEQVPIYSAPIRSRYLVDDPGAPHGRVDLVFSVDQFGRTDNVEIVGAVPAGLLEEAAARQVFRSLFRPAVLDGRVVATDSAFSWRFQYDPSVTPQFRDNMALND